MSLLLGFFYLLVLLLAYSNGGNDNFKGVATLYGSGTLGFGSARALATVATLLGSLLSVILARGLASTFSGKGLVPDGLINGPFLIAVTGGAMVTIFLATIIGMPTSTTHALTGALVGAALASAGVAGIGWETLFTKFAQPLLLSPIVAITITAVLYTVFRRLRLSSGVTEDTCICIGAEERQTAESCAGYAFDTLGPGGVTSASALSAGGNSGGAAGPHLPTMSWSQREHSAECSELRDRGHIAVSPSRVLDAVHLTSGAAVCFARAVNDTPKVAAMLLGARALGLGQLPGGVNATLLAVALAMALGGWLQSRKVAETMSLDIVSMNRGQGATANLVTAFLVLGASRFGLPVSTTHVSCGAIFGLSAATGGGRARTILKILTVWVTTLPLATGLAYLVYRLANPWIG